MALLLLFSILFYITARQSLSFLSSHCSFQLHWQLFFPLRAINVYHTWLHLVSSTDKQWLKHQCQAMSFNTSASLMQIVMAIWTLPHDFLLHNYSRSKSRGTYHEHINDVPLPQQCRTQNIFLEVSPLFNYLPALMTIVNNTILRIWKLLKVFPSKNDLEFRFKNEILYF